MKFILPKGERLVDIHTCSGMDARTMFPFMKRCVCVECRGFLSLSGNTKCVRRITRISFSYMLTFLTRPIPYTE